MSLHVDVRFHPKDDYAPKCPVCASDEWDSDGIVTNGLITRICSNCDHSNLDFATYAEKKRFERKTKPRKRKTNGQFLK